MNPTIPDSTSSISPIQKQLPEVPQRFSAQNFPFSDFGSVFFQPVNVLISSAQPAESLECSL